MESIKYIVLDVDGVMTDGGIYYDERGNELKKFCVRDAAGFFALQECGIEIIVLTGRECNGTIRRMKDMKVNFLFQNVKNKKKFLLDYMNEKNIKKNEIAYVGDDLNDFPPMKLCGFVACPKDACKEVKEISHYISPIKGGFGVIRDVSEYLLKNRGLWNKAVSEVYRIGV